MSTKPQSHDHARRRAPLFGACREHARRLLGARADGSLELPAGASAHTAGAGLEEQQALLIAALERAGGEPVSYQSLRDAGVEYPASVVSELELAGLPLERCYEGPLSERRLLGVRLELREEPREAPSIGAGSEHVPTPLSDWLERALANLDAFSALRALERAARRALAMLAAQARRGARAARHEGRLLGAWLSAKAPVAARAARRTSGVLGAWLLALWERAREAGARLELTGRSSARSSKGTARTPVRPALAARARRAAPRARWLAPAALIVASAIVLGLLLNALAGGGRTHRAVARRAVHSSGSAARAVRPAPPTRAPAAPPATAVSPALAAQLQTRGHALLEAGQPAGAIPVLQQALAATGENVAGCVEPVRETCLSYAYALYDLGRALLLDHQPAAAALILERRLRISNQREAVQSELQRARQQAARPRPS